MTATPGFACTASLRRLNPRKSGKLSHNRNTQVERRKVHLLTHYDNITPLYYQYLNRRNAHTFNWLPKGVNQPAKSSRLTPPWPSRPLFGSTTRKRYWSAVFTVVERDLHPVGPLTPLPSTTRVPARSTTLQGVPPPSPLQNTVSSHGHAQTGERGWWMGGGVFFLFLADATLRHSL